jgi:hypothetical protein
MASTTSKKLLRELPTVDEMHTRFFELWDAPDHVTAITGAAYLDSILENLIAASFRRLSDEDYTRMFSGAAGGILGSASAKIRLAYANKLIEDEAVYHDLKLINDIRNVFAHSLHRVDFNNDLIKADCLKLKTIIFAPRPEDPGRSAFMSVVEFLYGYLIGSIQKVSGNNSIDAALVRHSGESKSRGQS